MFNDITSVSLARAVDGLAQRQRVTADNLANMETPGFTASRVDFETNLAAAINAGRPGTSPITITKTTEAPGPNLNNVMLEKELVIATKTGLQQKLITGALTSRFGWVSTVTRG